LIHWYVVHSKPQKEEWLYKQLTALQFRSYYPCLHLRYQKPHLHKSKPYFPGYLFVNVDLELTGRSVLQWIPGSLGLVSFGGEPTHVPDELIQKIRRRVDQINVVRDTVLEALRPGENVVINSGPLAGYNAIFCSWLQPRERAQVLLSILQNPAIRIDLPADQLTPAKQSRTLL
jgi:transcriptional antiterminator RfaH